MTPTAARADWKVVDEGWGRRAVDFAALSEPSNCREYVALHHRLAVGDGGRLIDVACGAGLAIELAHARREGARRGVCGGGGCVAPPPRLGGGGRDRSPQADVRVGDMHAMPWTDA